MLRKGTFLDLTFEDIYKVRERNKLFELKNNRKRTAKIATFGCQMNENDSEKIMGLVREMGFEEYGADHQDLGGDISSGATGIDSGVGGATGSDSSVEGGTGSYSSVEGGAGSDSSVEGGAGSYSSVEGGTVGGGTGEGGTGEGGDGIDSNAEDGTGGTGETGRASAGETSGTIGGGDSGIGRGRGSGNGIDNEIAFQREGTVHERVTRDPDLIILNTCCVRENAENKFFGHLGMYKRVKEQNPGCVLAVCGCMMQEDGAVEEIKRKYKYVDIVFGAHNIHEFPQLLEKTYRQPLKGVYSIWRDSDLVIEGIPVSRRGFPVARVSIMYGCDNYCSYCIVPYVRGRERSRAPGDILDEVSKLAAEGYKEVLLLGQNVNSYGGGNIGIDFPDLLVETSRVKGIERIRFMTSHPKDLTNKLINTIRDVEPVCEHIHLPVQSGSSRVLAKMNRRYSREQYLELIGKIRANIPDVTLTTDIMVGFPGETEDDFEDTLDLVKTVRFDMAFTFIYSKRVNTPAAKYNDQVDAKLVNARFKRLVELQNKISLEMNKQYEGKELEVLCEGRSKYNHDRLTGRSRGGKLVNFDDCSNSFSDTCAEVAGIGAAQEGGGGGCAAREGGGGCAALERDAGGGATCVSYAEGGATRAGDSGGVATLVSDAGRCTSRVGDAGGGATCVSYAEGGATRVGDAGGGATCVSVGSGCVTCTGDIKAGDILSVLIERAQPFCLDGRAITRRGLL